MLDLGWSEILVIAVVLIVVVGPKDLPRVLRSFGRTTAKMRAMAGDFRRQFDEALREAELDDMKGLVDDVRKLDPRSEIRKHLSPLEEAGKEIRSGLSEAAKAKPAASSLPAADSKPAEPLKNGATSLGPEAPPPVTGETAAPKVSEKAEVGAVAASPGTSAKQAAPKAKAAAAAKAPTKNTASAPAKKPSPRRKKTAGTAP
ncbi:MULTISPECIES: Sec-independent protein translocase protein TatB [Chelativorans]|jgi:sec-independent protein translocase protein TatB|uniref:Sec-independent protein translocase protein TatB n=1 Tax=Chelativorans sp. (strain BNC1) TaxID=266779 RepID=TATB_CHESB|nr:MULTISPECIES: Sec-independent protein translocase protein TatB [Chelativorans]Q11HC6.1 RecName: Full=Sec-independent protein translocase protein TatB [Chelativorans sp. BNC1]